MAWNWLWECQIILHKLRSAILQDIRMTRHVSSMIHSARPIVTPHCFLLFCFSRFEKYGRTDGRTTCAKTMIPGRVDISIYLLSCLFKDYERMLWMRLQLSTSLQYVVVFSFRKNLVFDRKLEYILYLFSLGHFIFVILTLFLYHALTLENQTSINKFLSIKWCKLYRHKQNSI